MANICITYRHHPMTVGRFFKKAFIDLGHQVVSAGYSTGANIPWPGNPTFPQYADDPHIELGENANILPLAQLNAGLAELGFTPDVLVQVDAGFWYMRGGGEADIPPYQMIHVGTDPHALNYDKQRAQSNVFFCMQDIYKHAGDIWLPYAFDPSTHYYIPGELKYEICFIGVLSSADRERIIEWLGQRWNLFHRTGIIFEECNEIYNQALIGFNLSSADDLPMRFWEDGARRRLVVTNRVSDLEVIADKFGIEENKHYVAYEDVGELEEKLTYYIGHKDQAEDIARRFWLLLHDQQHTYLQRARQVLSAAGIGSAF